MMLWMTTKADSFFSGGASLRLSLLTCDSLSSSLIVAYTTICRRKPYTPSIPIIQHWLLLLLLLLRDRITNVGGHDELKWRMRSRIKSMPCTFWTIISWRAANAVLLTAHSGLWLICFIDVAVVHSADQSLFRRVSIYENTFFGSRMHKRLQFSSVRSSRPIVDPRNAVTWW